MRPPRHDVEQQKHQQAAQKRETNVAVDEGSAIRLSRVPLKINVPEPDQWPICPLLPPRNFLKSRPIKLLSARRLAKCVEPVVSDYD